MLFLQGFFISRHSDADSWHLARADTPRESLLQIFNLITSAKSCLPFEVTYSQVPEIRIQVSWGAAWAGDHQPLFYLPQMLNFSITTINHMENVWALSTIFWSAPAVPTKLWISSGQRLSLLFTVSPSRDGSLWSVKLWDGWMNKWLQL